MLNELKDITMGKSRLSYIGAAHGVLTHAGLWEGDIAELAGLTGLAFQFVVHESFCPSSVTVYDWAAVHFAAMDRIGVYTDCLSAVLQPGLNTADDLQEDAVKRIRESIDRGRGVVLWAPTPLLEFGIITGYDDEERIFSVIDCINTHPDPLLYDNLGRGEVPMLYLQRFFSRRQVDEEKLHRDALCAGVFSWRSIHPDPRYGRGLQAYDNMLSSLKARNFDPFGTGYCLAVYADAKNAASGFIKKAAASGLINGLDGVSERMERTASHFRAAADLVPFRGPQGTTVDPEKIPDLIKHLKECRRLEQEVMDELADRLGIDEPVRDISAQ